MAGTDASLDAELERLVQVLPPTLAPAVRALDPAQLLEIVLDLGRHPEARLPGRAIRLPGEAVSRGDLDHVLGCIGPLGGDNRGGIERTLHRISAIRNRRGEVVGLTLRVGRAVFGTIDTLRDLIGTGLNLLLLGRPGVGKTTKLRELARVLADEVGKRVMVVDTSNEIGGDGDVPHPGIGGSRRMQVERPDRQHAVMIEAVENHMPEVIVIDEIGTEQETAAARTIAERGVQLIATAHGNTLENLVLNPTLSDLVGGVQTVTLGDEEARRRGTQKTINERRAPPTFDVVVELVDRDEVLVHRDTARAVDDLLAGRPVGGERRRPSGDGAGIQVEQVETPPLPPPAPLADELPTAEGPVRVHGWALSRELLQRVVRELGSKVRLVDRPENADVVLVLRSRAGDARIRRVAERTGMPVRVLKKNSTSEMRRVLREVTFIAGGFDPAQVRESVNEAKHAIQRVLSEGVAVPLAPRPPRLRRLQHRLAARYHLVAASFGTEPTRHLVLQPSGLGEEQVEETNGP
ncbi:MAG TPA: R3H domain-containing nucleic acid-binding protein [Myxococcales bacterium]|jgi:stage III sporulation protein SpoIIIAA